MLSNLPNLNAKTIKELEELQHEPLTGGWEETFLNKLEGQNMFFDIELQKSARQNSSHNLHAPDCHAFAAVCT